MKTSVRIGDACPRGIRETLKHQTEEVILPAGQFENNQRELLRCSLQERGDGASVYVDSSEHKEEEVNAQRPDMDED